jgi:prepilin-type N-terminal cleavage/methylation domain-containing protein
MIFRASSLNLFFGQLENKMKRRCKKNGFTLTEMVVVVAIVALLTALGLPAIRSLQKTFETGSGVKATIDAALSTARAIAAKEQRYAGVRFELDFHDNQYMIFIIHDPEKTGLSNGFRAVEGVKPIKLPDDFRVIDRKKRLAVDPEIIQESDIGYTFMGLAPDLIEINPDAKDGQNSIIRDTSCFSIVFSPAGKLVIHPVRVRNRDGIYKPDNSIPSKVSMDDIFNSPENIVGFNTGMFIQDDNWPYAYGVLGNLGIELSRDRFYIYDKSFYNKLNNTTSGRLKYLNSLEPVFINQYTGTLVNSSK